MLNNIVMKTLLTHIIVPCTCGLYYEGASIIETPLGELNVDDKLRNRILATDQFETMERNVDEEEHSGEMQYPFIAKIINDARDESGKKRCDIQILPIMIGSIRTNKEESFGRLLSPYLSESSIFTVISSDFCHCE